MQSAAVVAAMETIPVRREEAGAAGSADGTPISLSHFQFLTTLAVLGRLGTHQEERVVILGSSLTQRF